MAKNEGYIKLFRSLLDWEWFDSPETLSVWIFLLLSANYKDTDWQGNRVKKGQIATSYPQISKKTGLSIQQVRTAVKRLKSTGEITCEPNNRYTLINIQKYADYQDIVNTLSNSQATDSQQTSNSQATDKHTILIKNKEIKNVKKVKNNTRARGKYANVFLSDDEIEKLKDEFPMSWEKKIDNLSEYLANNPEKHYASHFDTIWKWHKQDTKDVSFNIEKAEMRALDRTRDIGAKKNPKRKRG